MSYKYQKLNTPFSVHQQGNTVFENNGLSAFNDKTSEFLQKAMTLTTGTKKPKNQQIYSANSFFMKSSALREKIRITSERLVELNNLQKSSGLFNNEENKINDLMMLIGENIKQVEAGINEIERSSADECIRQSSAGPAMYQSIIETIKFTLLKIMDEYKKTTTKRMEDIAHNQQKPLFGAAVPGVERRGPRIQKAQFLVQNNNDDIEGGSSGQGYKQVDFKEKEQLQVSEAMKKLNTQLQSVYEMFKKIGSMVQFHESMIESIAENTDQAEANVNRSKKNIADAYRDASSSRGLIIKINSLNITNSQNFAWVEQLASYQYIFASDPTSKNNQLQLHFFFDKYNCSNASIQIQFTCAFLNQDINNYVNTNIIIWYQDQFGYYCNNQTPRFTLNRDLKSNISQTLAFNLQNYYSKLYIGFNIGLIQCQIDQPYDSTCEKGQIFSIEQNSCQICAENCIKCLDINTCSQCSYGYQNDNGKCTQQQKLVYQSKTRQIKYTDILQSDPSQISIKNPINQQYDIYYNANQYNNITYCSDFNILDGCKKCYENYYYSKQDQKCLPIQCGDNQYVYQNQCQYCSNDKIIVKKNQIAYCQVLNQASIVNGQVNLQPGQYLFNNGQQFQINDCSFCNFEYECEECFQNSIPGCLMQVPLQKCQICNSQYVLDNNGKCQFSQNNNISIYNQVVDNCLSYDINSKCINCKTYFVKDTSNQVTSCQEGYVNVQCTCYKCLKQCLNVICTLDCLCQIGQFYQGDFTSIVSILNCKPCQQGCIDCVSKSNNCTACQDGYILQNSQCLSCLENISSFNQTQCSQCGEQYQYIQGKCIKKCQENQYLNNDTLTCELCDLSCKSCQGLSNTDCYECNSYATKIQGVCQLCKSGQFYNYSQSKDNTIDIKNNCMSCDKQCKECNMKSDNCIICNVNDPNSTDGQKIKCLDKCPQGYYQQDNNCILCKQENCLHCNSNYCNQCIEGFELINNICLKSCLKTEFRDQSTFKCTSCNSTCKTCKGPNISDCTSCIQQLNLIEGKCQICDEGEFYNGDQLESIQQKKYDYSKCLMCHHTCENCQGPLDTDCIKCSGGLQINPQTKLCITQKQFENQSDQLKQCQNLEINAKDFEDCQSKLNQIELFKSIDDGTDIAVWSVGTFFSLFQYSSSVYFWSFMQNQQLIGNNYNLAPKIGQGITQNQFQNMHSFNFFNLIQSPFQSSSKKQRLLLTTQSIGQYYIENCFYQSLAIILSVLILPLLFILGKFSDKINSFYNYSKWNLSIRTCMLCSNLFILFFILGIKNSQFTQALDDKNLLICFIFAGFAFAVYSFTQIKSIAFILCYQYNWETQNYRSLVYGIKDSSKLAQFYWIFIELQKTIQISCFIFIQNFNITSWIIFSINQYQINYINISYATVLIYFSKEVFGQQIGLRYGLIQCQMNEVTQNSCQLGQYFDQNSNSCMNCGQDCVRCDQQTKLCIEYKPTSNLSNQNFFIYQIKQISSESYQGICLFTEDCKQINNFQNCAFLSQQQCFMCQQNYVLSNNLKCKSSLNNNISIYNQIVDGCIKYDDNDQYCIACLANYFLVDQQPYCSLRTCPQGYILIQNKCFICNQDNCLNTNNCTVDCYCQKGYFYQNQGTQNICQKCDNKCELCTNISSQCQSCKIYDPSNTENCIEKCPDEYFQQGKYCISCQNFDYYCSKCSQAECQQCREGYIKINNKCFPCNQNNCLDQINCTVDCYCEKGYFYKQNEKIDKSNCQKCDLQCELCTENKSKCIACKIIDPQNKDNCLDSCPIGYFQKEKNCIPCTNFDSNCSQCNTVECLKCKQEFDLINKSCHQKCQSNQFRNPELNCQQCHMSCSTCSGSLETDCITCINSVSFNDIKICQICDKGYFYNQLNSPQNGNFDPQNCQKCDPQCLECHKQSNACLKCKINDPLIKSNCLAQCPDRYYQQDNICKQCQSNCLICTQNKCNLCEEGYDIVQNQCSLKCQQNQFRDTASLQCQDCHFSCQKCNGSSSKNCTSCIKQLNLNQQGECSICDEGEFYKGNQEEAILVFKYDYSKCFSCHVSCQDCTGPSNTECTSCMGSLLIHPQSKLCVEKAEVDQLNNQLQQCSNFQIEPQDLNGCTTKLDQIDLFKKVQQVGSITFTITGSVASILLSSASIYFMSSLQSQQFIGNYYILAPQISKGEVSVYLQDMYSLNIFNLISNPFLDSQASTSPPSQPQQASQRILLVTQDIGQMFIENCFYQSIFLICSILVLPILFAFGVLNLVILSIELVSNYLQKRKTQRTLNSQINIQAVEQITDARITEFFDSKRIVSKYEYLKRIKFS
ncbi:hypothetical protein ABPG74_009348 [Tetrahymena malaccensis]